MPKSRLSLRRYQLSIWGQAGIRAIALISPLLLTGLTTAHAAPATPAAKTCVTPAQWADGAGALRSASDVLGRAARAPAVLLGERHDMVDHHRWQLQTLVAMHALNPHLAIGLEMMPKRLQPVLDRWTQGKLSEAEFLRESDWAGVWGFDPAFYMPILHFARMHRLPVIGLNVERALVSRTAREGWAKIPPEAREGIGDPVQPPDAYKAKLRRVMESHGSGQTASDTIDRFIEAQSVWDRGMGQRMAEAHQADGRTVVAIIGMGHAEERHGVPHQLDGMGLPGSVVLLPWDAERACTELTGTIADAVFGLDPVEVGEPARRIPLGAALEAAPADGPRGARLRKVNPASVAEAAGLREGDLVIEAAGHSVARPADLTAVVQRVAPGTWLPLRILRNGEERMVVARFLAPA